MRIISANDPLTGLANRVLFESRLKLAKARMQRSGRALAVLFLDFDDFKQVNNKLGYDAGDDLLRQFSWRLLAAFRPQDTIARFGGDDFAILVEDLASPAFAELAARKIIGLLAAPFQLCGQAFKPEISIGITTCVHGQHFAGETLLQQADAAMHDAKLQPGSFYRTFHGLLSHLAQASAEDEMLAIARE
jgi:diguanylate cyclase (GGDEF)-like protein